jgi:hypothetical protein
LRFPRFPDLIADLVHVVGVPGNQPHLFHLPSFRFENLLLFSHQKSRGSNDAFTRNSGFYTSFTAPAHGASVFHGPTLGGQSFI